MNNSKSIRNQNIDVLKGVAIILVIIGHAIQISLVNYDDNIIFKIIYSFHMPLFMFLSGYTAFFSNKQINSFEFIKRKFINLIVPFFSWGIFVGYIILNNYSGSSFKEYLRKLILYPDYGLWFLWVLFFNFVILTIIVRIQKYTKIKYDIIIPIIVILIIRVIPTSILGIGLFKWHLPFFLLGYYTSRNSIEVNKYCRLFKEASYVLFPLLLLGWNRVDEKITFNFNNKFIILGYKYFVALMGITIVYYTIEKMDKNIIYKKLSSIGRYTLDIYAIHAYLLKNMMDILLNSGDWLHDIIIITFISLFFLGASLTISKVILQQSKILKLLLLGKYKQVDLTGTQ